jgi:hypothetical protein
MLCWKAVKWSVMAGVGAMGAGMVLFGGDLVSYARSSVGAVRSTVKDSVPMDFELRRARDMVEQIVPELHANVRLIAQEEVEVASLQEDIAASSARLASERTALVRQREMLGTEQVLFTLGGQRYERSEVVADLARRADHVGEAQVILASKERLLKSRQGALESARQALAKSRTQKALLEDRVEALESQYRLVQAAGHGSSLAIDGSKLAQTQQLIDQIKKRLDVAERVLAHEARFTAPIPLEAISEEKVLAEVDELLSTPTQLSESEAAEGAARASRN